MKNKFNQKETATGLVILIVILILISGCHKLNEYFNLPDDNQIEQGIEDVIENETGLVVDFTPNSPESSK